MQNKTRILIIIVGLIVNPLYLNASVNKPVFSALPAAKYTVDDWFTNPSLWNVTISNTGDNKTVSYLLMNINISTSKYGTILDGSLRVVGPTTQYLKNSIIPGESFTVTNIMVTESTSQMRNGGLLQEFKNAVFDKMGFMPEGQYNIRFAIEGRYNDGTVFGGPDNYISKGDIIIEKSSINRDFRFSPIRQINRTLLQFKINHMLY